MTHLVNLAILAIGLAVLLGAGLVWLICLIGNGLVRGRGMILKRLRSARNRV